MQELLYIGTYTEPILFGTGEVFQGKGRGVYRCLLTDAGLERQLCLPMRNPSSLCVDGARERLYAVNELKELDGVYGGGITVARLGAEPRVLATVPTGGTDPCHIALAPNGRFVATANFADGSLTVQPLDAQGLPCGAPQRSCHSGHGPHPVRQRGPHAHSVIFVPGTSRLLVPDLGLDRLVAYTWQQDRVERDPAGDVTVAPGSGPRSGTFSPDGRHFYLLNELASTVTHFTVEDGALRQQGTYAMLPADFDPAASIGSDLHLTPDGRFLYAANRGHDSLCCFAVADDGALTLRRRVPCGGRTPRNFAITPDGHGLLVGNQDSDQIVHFEIGADGDLRQRAVYPFPSPVCLRFAAGAG